MNIVDDNNLINPILTLGKLLKGLSAPPHSNISLTREEKWAKRVLSPPPNEVTFLFPFALARLVITTKTELISHQEPRTTLLRMRVVDHANGLVPYHRQEYSHQSC